MLQRDDIMRILDELNDIEIVREIGRRVTFLRIRSGLRQEDLAERVGVSRFAISRLEGGQGGMRLDTFLAVLRQLNVLGRMSIVLPEREPTPLEIAKLERKGGALPKRVRKSAQSAKPVLRWGDGTPINR